MLCEDGANSTSDVAGEAVDSAALFTVVCVLLSLSFCAFCVLKSSPLSSNTTMHKFFEVRWSTSVFLTHLGCILVGITHLKEGGVVSCDANALSVLAPALLILPPAIRLFNFRQQCLLSQTTAREARDAQDTLISPRGSLLLLPNRIAGSFSSSSNQQFHTYSYPRQLVVRASRRATVLLRTTRAIVLGRLRRADFDVETMRLLRNAGSGNVASRMLVLAIAPLIVMCIILAANHATPEVVRGVRWVAYVVCLMVLGVVVVRCWRLPDPFLVVYEVNLAVLLFLPSTVVLILLDRPEALITGLFYCLAQSVLVPVWMMLVRNATRRGGKNPLAKSSTIVFASLTEEFEHCLAHSKLHGAFFLHLTTEHSVDSLIFYDEIYKWRREFHDLGARTAYIRAKKIVHCYVGDDAIFPVNLPGHLIVTLRTGVDLDTGTGGRSSSRKRSNFQRSFRKAHSTGTTKKRSNGGGGGGEEEVAVVAAMVDNNYEDVERAASSAAGTHHQAAASSPPPSPTRNHQKTTTKDRGMSIFRVRFVSFAVDEAEDKQPEKPSVSAGVDVDFFQEAERQIKMLMQMDGFNRFKRTKAYLDLLRQTTTSSAA